MKVFVPDEELDDKIKKLIRSFRKQMNGETTEQMEKRGIHYRHNFGIGLVHLREKAAALPGNIEFADRLWHRRIRETMILASMVAPKDEMTIEKSREWAELIDNCELVEQTALNLYGKLPFAGELADKWFSEDNDYLMALAFYILGWMFRFQTVPDKLISTALDNAKEIWGSTLFCAYRGTAHFIRQMLRVKPEKKQECDKLVSHYEKTGDKNVMWLMNEIKSELDFL